jgi:hypothetical protein
VEPLARALPFGDFYLYSPFRFRYALLIVIPLLAGFGVDAWRRAHGAPGRWWLLVPGVALWWLLPLVAGVRPQRLWLLALGAAAGTVILAGSIRRPRLLLAVPALLAVELVASGLIGQASSHEFFVTGLGQARSFRPLTPLLEPTIEAASYVRPGLLATLLRSGDFGRYLSLDPVRGYLGYQDPRGWPFLTDQRGMLFEIEEAQGYNPVQPLRYWAFVRAVNPHPELHNVSVLRDPSPAVLDLLGIEWLIAPADQGAPEQTAVATASEGAWTLWRRGDPPPRASIVDAWRVVADRGASLRAVIDPGFPSRAEVVLESGPDAPSRSNPLDVSRIGPEFGTLASFRWVGPQEAIVRYQSARGGILVVRNGYDPNWRAALDGEPATVVPADHFLQGIRVPSGRHTVVLTYDDPWIGYGLAGTGVALAGLCMAAFVLRRRSPKTSQPMKEANAAQATAETARP